MLPVIMNALFWWTGAAVWMAVALVPLILMVRLMLHAVEAAVFAERLRRHDRKPTWRLRYWWFAFTNPADLAYVDDAEVEWPHWGGREEDYFGRTHYFTSKPDAT